MKKIKKKYNDIQFTYVNRDHVYLVIPGCFYLSRPFWAAAPPGIILVMKMEGSSPMWGLSVPPAMLNPRPELPCTHKGTGETNTESTITA